MTREQLVLQGNKEKKKKLSETEEKDKKVVRERE